MIRGALSVSKYIWTQTQSFCARELIITFLDGGWHETKRKQCPQVPTQILKHKPERVKHKSVNVVLTLYKTYIWIHLLHLFLSVTCCEQSLSPVWDILGEFMFETSLNENTFFWSSQNCLCCIHCTNQNWSLQNITNSIMHWGFTYGSFYLPTFCWRCVLSK